MQAPVKAISNVHSFFLKDTSVRTATATTMPWSTATTSPANRGAILIFHGQHKRQFPTPHRRSPTFPTPFGEPAQIIGVPATNGGNQAILYSTSAGMGVLLEQGTSLTFTHYPTLSYYNIGPGSTSFTIADFDGDGAQDVAVDSPEGNALVLGHGDGNFMTSLSYGVGPIYGPTSLGGTPAGTAPRPDTAGMLGDFNNDGKLDVAIATADMQASILPGNGDGTFSFGASISGGSDNPALYANIAAGYFQGNGGDLDLGAAHAERRIGPNLGHGPQHPVRQRQRNIHFVSLYGIEQLIRQ